MLDFCDREIVEALRVHLRDLAVTFRFGEEVTAVAVGAAGTVTTLASGKQIPAGTVMYSAGRQGQTDHLDLAKAGLETDNRGRIIVDDQFQTKVDHIYAVGDVIGFPALGDLVCAVVPILLAQFAFEDFPGSRHRQGLDEFHTAWRLVAGDQRFAVLAYVGLSGLMSGLEYHDGVHAFTDEL